MKPDKIALPGSVAIISLVYTVAMAAAPATGLSAQANPPKTDRIARLESHARSAVVGAATWLPVRIEAIGTGGTEAQPQCANATRACPFTAKAEISFSQLMQVHHRLPVSSLQTPRIAGPDWGNAKLTVF